MIEEIIQSHKPYYYMPQVLMVALRKCNTSRERQKTMMLYEHFMDRYTYNHIEMYHKITDSLNNDEFLEHQARVGWRYMKMCEYTQKKINEQSAKLFNNSNCTMEVEE
jgi:hypothetical protein